eukprot:tig00020616_g12280.t1
MAAAGGGAGANSKARASRLRGTIRRADGLESLALISGRARSAGRDGRPARARAFAAAATAGRPGRRRPRRGPARPSPPVSGRSNESPRGSAPWRPPRRRCCRRTRRRGGGRLRGAVAPPRSLPWRGTPAPCRPPPPPPPHLPPRPAPADPAAASDPASARRPGPGPASSPLKGPASPSLAPVRSPLLRNLSPLLRPLSPLLRPVSPLPLNRVHPTGEPLDPSPRPLSPHAFPLPPPAAPLSPFAQPRPEEPALSQGDVPGGSPKSPPGGPAAPAPRRFSSSAVEVAFLSHWNRTRAARARRAAGYAAPRCWPSPSGRGPRAAPGAGRLAPLAGALAAGAAAGAALAFALLPRGEASLLRRHWQARAPPRPAPPRPAPPCVSGGLQAVAFVAIPALYGVAFFVARLLELPSCLLVALAAGPLFSASVVPLRSRQVLAVNGIGILLAAALAASSTSEPARAWEIGIALPVCLAATAAAAAAAAQSEADARELFLRTGDASAEVRQFREEFAPLVDEIESFRYVSSAMEIDSPLASAIDLLARLFDELVNVASIVHAASVAAALRHLLTFYEATEDPAEGAIEAAAASGESGEILRSFQDYMGAQGAAPARMLLRSASIKRPLPFNSSRSFSAAAAAAAAGAGGGPGRAVADALSDALKEALAAACRPSWEAFDCLKLEQAAGGRPLELLATHLADRYRILEASGVDPAKFRAFVAAVEAGYQKVPYHSAIHAADVLQALVFLVQCGGIPERVHPNDVLAAVVSAIIHDVGHAGRSNGFEIATESELALLYNDRSVLENNSLTWSFAVLRDPGKNFVSHLNRERRSDFRRLVIDMVLGTDMAKHFKRLGDFKARVLASTLGAARGGGGSGGGVRLSRQRQGTAVTSPGSQEGEEWDPLSPRGAGPFSPEDRTLFLVTALKIADISNAARPLQQHVEWCTRVNEEFYRQGDEERRAGLPLSQFCDRTSGSVAATSAGFASFIAVPLFQAWASRFPAARPLVERAQANMGHWRALLGQPPHASPGASQRPSPPHSAARASTVVASASASGAGRPPPPVFSPGAAWLSPPGSLQLQGDSGSTNRSPHSLRSGDSRGTPPASSEPGEARGVAASLANSVRHSLRLAERGPPEAPAPGPGPGRSPSRPGSSAGASGAAPVGARRPTRRAQRRARTPTAHSSRRGSAVALYAASSGDEPGGEEERGAGAPGAPASSSPGPRSASASRRPSRRRSSIAAALQDALSSLGFGPGAAAKRRSIFSAAAPGDEATDQLLSV